MRNRDGLIESGTLPSDGQAYDFLFLDAEYLPQIVALHDFVLQTLPPEEKSFILPRTLSYFADHFAKGDGNIITGVFVGNELVAKSVILHPPAGARADDLGGALLDSPPDQTSILQAATVHPDYRNRGLLRLMVRHWLCHAEAHNKTYAHAEIEVRNIASWQSFLKSGMNIVKIGYSPVDGAQVYSAAERIKYAMIRQFPGTALCDESTVECAPHDIETQKRYMKEGYVVIGAVPDSGALVLKKKT